MELPGGHTWVYFGMIWYLLEKGRIRIITKKPRHCELRRAVSVKLVIASAGSKCM